jgi:serine/threonine protein kinase/Flp pilus assembly protein TadD
VDRLAEEMAAAWERGDCPPAEDFLARQPELLGHPEAALRLIYEEVCLRRELAGGSGLSDVFRRFPQWREQLTVLFECQRLVEGHVDRPVLPEPGGTLGEFALLLELGRGGAGRVYLARQSSLGDRPVVLKITPCAGQEHLALARLRHPHVVPLYSVHEFVDPWVRALCMPYLGGASLGAVLARLRPLPAASRAGRSLLEALDAEQRGQPLPPPGDGPARQALAGVSYVQAVCWFGACLADALHYAHGRGLVHLDLKPSNVLLTADAQPMLLDFHLAREPIPAGGPAPAWLGGTPGYMPPEQVAACTAARRGDVVSVPVDGRADIFSLGRLLYAALAGQDPGDEPPRLERLNPQVGAGVADIVRKCLAPDPAGRYPTAAALADDLRRHLADLPLRGVPNRSLAERWRKWRRRRPYAPLALALLLALVAAATLLGTGIARRYAEAGRALREGEDCLGRRAYAEAATAFRRGRDEVGSLPGALAGRLDDRLRLARRAQAAQELHAVAERIRFLAGADLLPADGMRAIERQCRTLWDTRTVLARPGGTELDPEMEKQVRTDFLDLVILWADLHVRLAPAGAADAARCDALQALEEAEAVLGPSRALARERRSYDPAALPVAGDGGAEAGPESPWEHTALGRSLLRAGRLEAAAAVLDRAADQWPEDFWANFYDGVCAHRSRRYADAVRSFSVAVALAPKSAECYYNRALAEAGEGSLPRALRDYDRALQLDPALAAARLNRGILHFQEKRYAEALTDLLQAARDGADPVLAHYNLALVWLAQGEPARARESVEEALRHDPAHAAALALRERLRRNP